MLGSLGFVLEFVLGSSGRRAMRLQTHLAQAARGLNSKDERPFGVVLSGRDKSVSACGVPDG
ncbi:hypothetical protein ASG35_13495 [Burkholderia sp. Leaf177]|nr:hypothetical protein ASG35_13495 [Burkholderia sp. Leaf177]